jgi:hypothetical protein
MAPSRDFLTGAATGALVTAAAARLVLGPHWRVARMPGSSVAAPAAAGWVTDFLNAAYYRRPPSDRDLADLRMAHGVLATYWWRHGYRRLRARDLLAFNRAFGGARLASARLNGVLGGTLSGTQLREGAAALLGDWFPQGWADPDRRAWGIGFPSTQEREAYRPEERIRHASLGPLTPPVAPPDQQTWHTYPAVRLPDPDRALAGLLRPETWPDFGCELGHFTPVREGGLHRQTFEVELVGLPDTPALGVLRAFVTCTRALTGDDPDALRAHADELNAGMPGSVPDGAEPVAAIDLTTHEGHFLGNARSRLVVFRDADGTSIRDVGQWDPLPWPLRTAYERAGYQAQQAFWGGDPPEQSVLAQLAEVTRD